MRIVLIDRVFGAREVPVGAQHCLVGNRVPAHGPAVGPSWSPGNGRRCHSAITDRQETAIIPIRKNDRPWKKDCPAAMAGKETRRAMRRYGPGTLKALNWRPSPTPDRGKTRCRMVCDARIAANDPDCHTAEIRFRVALRNRFNAFGIAEIVPVA